MPLGNKTIPASERVYQIKILRPNKPVVNIVPPQVRPGSKQRSVIRYDAHGQYFVDDYIERGVVPDEENRECMAHIHCERYQFTLALVVCPHYCAFPCDAHLERVKAQGWFYSPKKPLHSRAVGGGSTSNRRRKKEEGAEDDD